MREAAEARRRGNCNSLLRFATVFVDLLNTRGAQFGNQSPSWFLFGGLRLNLERMPAADSYTRAVRQSKLHTSVATHMCALALVFLPFSTLHFHLNDMLWTETVFCRHFGVQCQF